MKHDYEMIVIPYYLMGRVQYLPTLKKDGKEIYRGEYKNTSTEAMERIQVRLDQQISED